MATCKSCGASIIWTTTAVAGKAQPLDAVPVPNGNIILVDGKAAVTKEPLAEDELRYMSHHATCPYAHRHRK
jgi:hypothetical protein